jgi:hypothetical protein
VAEVKIIVAGSRTIDDLPLVAGAVHAAWQEWGCPDVEEFVSGCADGVDRLGERIAQYTGKPVMKFPADWSRWGRAAGPRRNKEMAEYADALVLVWDGKSPGSRNMLTTMQALGTPIYECIR